jgi:hypothetical protein
MLAGPRANLLGLVSATALLISPATRASAEVPARRGAVAFQYAPSLTAGQLAWYSRFDVLVTHDPLPPEQVRALHDAGTKVLFYEWAVAFYESRATPWQRTLIRGRKSGLLHSRALRGGVGSATAPAWYFDPATESHRTGRVADLVRRLDETGYDGIFFDTLRFESVHPDARKTYARRHPDTPYDAAFAGFLAALRERMGARILFTNQGYRSAEHYLPYVDWDLTESLITRPEERGVDVRPWNDAHDPWNSIHFVMRTMIEPVVTRYPKVRFAHLNYADAADGEAIRLAVAVAQLFGGDAYVASQDLQHEQDDIYFRDPGPPAGPRVDWAEDTGAHRFFEHGLIAVSASPVPVTIDRACGGAVTIPPSPGRPRAWFFDAPKCSDDGD